MVDIDTEGKPFKKIRQLLADNFLPYQTGKTFTADEIWYKFNFHKRKYPTESGYSNVDIRLALDQVLYYITKVKKTPELEQVGNRYRLIDRTTEELKFWEADADNMVGLRWPFSPEDDTDFMLDNVEIFPGSPMIVAGASNQGKSAFCLNFALLNMENYPVLYMSNEWSGEQLAQRLKPFGRDFKEIQDRIRFIKRYRDWADVIEPNHINIVDYLRSDDAYLIGGMINSIKEKLDKGIAVIALQKPSGRSEGYGGNPTMWDAQLYLSIDKEKLTIVKAKSFNGANLNDKKFSFKLINKGSQFHDIQEID